MKKFYVLALGALLLATGCSKDDPEPVLPGLNVVETTLNPTYTQIQAPAQTKIETDIYDLIVSYENGQVIEYTPSQTAANVLLVTALKGKNVIVPTTVTVPATETEPRIVYTVGGWQLQEYEAIGSDVLTITIPTVTGNSMQGNQTDGIFLRPFNNEFFTDLSDKAENLSAVYLEEGFKNFMSDGGVIYRNNTLDHELVLVMVPRNYQTATKAFTVPEEVDVIGKKAFAKCEQFERVIISQNVKRIEDLAFDLTKNLIAIDMLPETAPAAAEHAFGSYARKATLRIPTGSRESYLLSNPFEVIEPNTTHPVPPTSYVNGMGFERNKYSETNTADWTEEDWVREVPEPVAPGNDATTSQVNLYNNARAGYANYQAAMKQYETDLNKWNTAAKEWNDKDEQKILKDAEPLYPGVIGIEMPKRPIAPGADATEEEVKEYNVALQEYYDSMVEYQANLGAVTQFEVDQKKWIEAKNAWESTRAYKFFNKVQEVTFIY